MRDDFAAGAGSGFADALEGAGIGEAATAARNGFFGGEVVPEIPGKKR